MSDNLLEPKDVAKKIGYTISALQKWRREGVGPNFLKLTDSPNGGIRYRESDVDKWIESRLVLGKMKGE